VLKQIFLFLILILVPACLHATTVSLEGNRWYIDGQITNPGSPAAGLLMNVRMVNSTFEDRNRTDFDSEANTNRFLAKIPEYKSCGVNAFTLNLQGGFPNYEGALNSAFNPDGSLREEYIQRVARVIEACDQQGLVVILGLFYQRQDQVLQDEETVKDAVVNALQWIEKKQYNNVVIEIANEYSHGGFDHAILRTPEGEVDLLRLARQTAPRLLLSTSGVGDGTLHEDLIQAVDYLLIHFNNTKVQEIPARIQKLQKYKKAIVCNEDDKVGEEGAQALRASIAHGCSWGFMHSARNQYQPFEFLGIQDDPLVYAAFKQETNP
jgi:hypothetical protein